MADFIHVTSNDMKALVAKQACDRYDITFERQKLDLIEPQADDGEVIARHKIEQAFMMFKQAVVISDDDWVIPALNGFPGPYMKYVNGWFTPDDYLRLMHSVTDRTIILRQIVAYQDAYTQKVFSADIPGILLEEARGISDIPLLPVLSFDDGAHSVAEHLAQGFHISLKDKETAWDGLCEWLKDRGTR